MSKSVDFDKGVADDTFDWGDLAIIPDSDVDFSVEGWVRIEAFTGFTEPFGKGDLTSGWYIGSGTEDAPDIVVRFDDTREAIIKESASTNTWLYVAFVHDASANTVNTYHGSVAGGLDSPLETTAIAGPTTGSSPMSIGSVISFVGGDTGFNGQLALIRVWNKTLTQEEIELYWDKHINAKIPNLVFNWDSSLEGEGVSAVAFINQVNYVSSTTVSGTPTRSAEDPGLETIVDNTMKINNLRPAIFKPGVAR